jgi:hypothetical protein
MWLFTTENCSRYIGNKEVSSFTDQMCVYVCFITAQWDALIKSMQSQVADIAGEHKSQQLGRPGD